MGATLALDAEVEEEVALEEEEVVVALRVELVVEEVTTGLEITVVVCATVLEEVATGTEEDVLDAVVETLEPQA